MQATTIGVEGCPGVEPVLNNRLTRLLYKQPKRSASDATLLGLFEVLAMQHVSLARGPHAVCLAAAVLDSWLPAAAFRISCHDC